MSDTVPNTLTDEERSVVIGMLVDAMTKDGGLPRDVATLLATEMLAAVVAQAQARGVPYGAVGDTTDEVMQHILIDAMLKANPEAAKEFGVTFPDPAGSTHKEFNPNQPRDDHGRFGSGGSGSSGGGEVRIGLPAVSASPGAVRSDLLAGEKIEIPRAAVPVLLDSLAGAPPPPVNLEQVKVEGERTLFDTHYVSPDGQPPGIPGVSKDGEYPREAMPVIPSDDPPGAHASAQDFVDKILSPAGVGATFETVDPRTLTATQNQLDAGKAGGILKAIDSGALRPTTLVVSSDGHILDGHHRWAAMAAHATTHPDFKVEVLRVNEPIAKLLTHGELYDTASGIPHNPFGGGKAAKQWTKARAAHDVPTSPVPDADEPWVWARGAWHLLATDTADGVPRTLRFPQKDSDPG